MPVRDMCCGVSSSALIVGNISHAPVPASLPRDRAFCFFAFILACFPVPTLSSLLE